MSATRPEADERWRLKTDHSKVLFVKWTNTCDYVCFEAPWMIRSRTTLKLTQFLKRYEITTEVGF